MNLDEPSTEVKAARSRQIMRRSIWLIALLALMSASYALGRVTIKSNGLPEIAATLPGDESDFSRELDERIRERFPVGSAEEPLLYYLRTQNFTPDWRQRDDPNTAYFLHQGLICEQTIRVTWRADASGRLTSIGGEYESHCI
jgi:hypothetical protein